jgi:murein DD-endopeptidase MepM/ murein hydrolase activator NlpD
MIKVQHMADFRKPLYPVMNFPAEMKHFKNINGEDLPFLADFVASGNWGWGGYLDKRENMYVAPHFQSLRKIHVGIDIWAPVGEPVFAPLPGVVSYTANHNRNGDYGATVVIKHISSNDDLFALYGHLSEKSLQISKPGKKVQSGDIIGWIGNDKENGNWPPHLHLQISTQDPGSADMPGVVSEKELNKAIKQFPDPRILLGKFLGK